MNISLEQAKDLLAYVKMKKTKKNAIEPTHTLRSLKTVAKLHLNVVCINYAKYKVLSVSLAWHFGFVVMFSAQHTWRIRYTTMYS